MSNYELYHHGILGMKWGVRRYQNPDGTLTDEGRKRIEKANNRINVYSKRERGLSNAYEIKKEYADKYRSDSSKYPPRNNFIKLMRKYTQFVLDLQARDAKVYADIGKSKLQREINRIGKMPYAKLDVYLADIWNLPYDRYEVRSVN